MQHQHGKMSHAHVYAILAISLFINLICLGSWAYKRYRERQDRLKNFKLDNVNQTGNLAENQAENQTENRAGNQTGNQS